MTDAHGASSAIWPPPLRRPPPEQAKATGKWQNNIRRGNRGLVSQSEQLQTRAFQRTPATFNDQDKPGVAGAGDTTGELRDRDRWSQCLALSPSGRFSTETLCFHWVFR